MSDIFTPTPFDDLVRQIVAFNRAWKLAKDRWGPDHPLTLAARDRKSSLQADLLRDHPDLTHLVTDPEGSEPLFSVRLNRAVQVGQRTKRDAEHLPVRLANDILLPDEIAERSR